MTTIHIDISGPVQSGKTAALQSIKSMLEDHGYCVAIPDRGERLNPGPHLRNASGHEKPKLDEAVFILREHVTPNAHAQVRSRSAAE